jgi:histidine kinase 2/3/4 (cytokinin receptor)
VFWYRCIGRYLGASYDVPSLVDKLLHQLAGKQTIVVNVYDTTNASAPITMYGTDVIDTGLLHISGLDFGDPLRKHEMHCRFVFTINNTILLMSKELKYHISIFPFFFARFKHRPQLPGTAIFASAGVFAITLLLGYIFHAAINQIAKVEDDYRQMRELLVRAEVADVAKSQVLYISGIVDFHNATYSLRSFLVVVFRIFIQKENR